MYVSDGFTHEEETMPAPSVTNKFLASCNWLCGFSTEVLGSCPIRAVPISWMVSPGALSSTNGSISCAPDADSISAAVIAISCKSAFSFCATYV